MRGRALRSPFNLGIKWARGASLAYICQLHLSFAQAGWILLCAALPISSNEQHQTHSPLQHLRCTTCRWRTTG